MRGSTPRPLNRQPRAPSRTASDSGSARHVRASEVRRDAARPPAARTPAAGAPRRWSAPSALDGRELRPAAEPLATGASSATQRAQRAPRGRPHAGAQVGQLGVQPVRAARPAVLLEPPGVGGLAAPRRPRGARRASATSEWTSAATAAASATVACASGTRTSSVPNAGCGRSSHHQRRGSGTARTRRPRQRVGERLPRADRRRHPLARQLLGDLRPDRGEPGVAAVVERRVGGERGDQRAATGAAVVDRERAVGAADGDVDLQRARRAGGARSSPYSSSVSA